MKQQGGVSHMEVIFIAIAVLAIGFLLLNKFVLEPETQAEVTQEDRLKMQINSLENKLKAYEGIEQRFVVLEGQAKDLLDRMEHAEHNISDVDKFSKANKVEIDKYNTKFADLNKVGHDMKSLMTQAKAELTQMSKTTASVPDIVKVQLEEWKKPLAVALQQSRAQRPVLVNWKKYRGEDGKYHWAMTDRQVEYSRAEYLRKLKKQRAEKKNAKQ